MKEKKYFIGYVAYARTNDRTDFFNNVVYIDEDITMTLIEKIQTDLLNILNEEKDRYYAIQIISFSEII